MDLRYLGTTSDTQINFTLALHVFTKASSMSSCEQHPLPRVVVDDGPCAGSSGSLLQDGFYSILYGALRSLHDYSVSIVSRARP